MPVYFKFVTRLQNIFSLASVVSTCNILVRRNILLEILEVHSFRFLVIH